MLRTAALAFALTLPSFFLSAQNAPTRSPEPTGILTGQVFCSDTNQPARFAKVSLEAVHSAPSNARITPATFTSNGITSVDTALDGTFTLTRVRPGSYYVIVSKPGYISPRAMFTQKEIDAPSDDTRSLIERVLPRVDIENNQTAHTEVRLERGAALSGTITYDDGSPASELSVSLLHKDRDGKWVPLQGAGFHSAGWADTDDRGHFRFSSLLPDEYLLKTQLTLGNTRETSMPGPNGTQMVVNMATYRSNLPFYGTGTPHQAEAKSIKLLGGEERTGQDMTLPISKLFRVTGHVVAGRNGHAVNAAELKLLSKDDNTELTSSDIDREDGLFHFDFVPAGSYTLQISNARDVVWEAERPDPKAPASPFPLKDKERVLEKYGSTELPLLVDTDKLGMTATIPPDAAKQ